MHLAPERCATFEQYTPVRHVMARTPPTFIYHTIADRTVPVDASVTVYRALAPVGVPVEMHNFATGRHRTGRGVADAAPDLWRTLLEVWLRQRGLLTQVPRTALRRNAP